jgi:heme/copper-type cytochrome/quinol oxidase subunit 4
MCFSPTVSFTAAAGLTVIGILTVRKTSVRGELLLACVPFFFAAQQLIEGFLWLTLMRGHSPDRQYWLTQAYFVFVGIIWPIYIPLSVLCIESNKRRKQWMMPVVLLGLGVACYTTVIITKFGITANISNHCILYDDPVTQGWYMTAIYVIATCAAFFLSSFRSVVQLGLMYMSTLLLAYGAYRLNYVSVWCFFAAAFSGALYIHLNRRLANKSAKIKFPA